MKISKKELIKTIVYYLGVMSEENIDLMENPEYLDTINLNVPDTNNYITVKEIQEILERELLGGNQ